MSNKLRRFEILLPQQFNDGSDVPRELLGLALDEIVEMYGAASFEPQAVEGIWVHEGMVYRDSLSKIVIDIPNTIENREWMREFKQHWMNKLKQLEIWLVSYEIDID